MLLYISWNIDPEIFSIGPLTIRWYGLFFMFSFLFGFYLLERIFKAEGKLIKDLDRLSLYVGIGTLIGARLGHCFFYQRESYLENPLEILMVWHGGLASHGAVIGILIAVYFFVRNTENKSITYFWTLDRIAIVVALAAFLVRMGNLMNSEIYGIETDVPWAFLFERDALFAKVVVPRHPTQIYEALSYLVLFGLMMFFYWKKSWGKYSGKLLGFFFIWLFTARFFIEFIKEVQEKFETEYLLKMGQILSLPLILIGIILFFKSKKIESAITESNELAEEKES